MKTAILLLLCSILSIHLPAQTQIKGARSWKIMSSLVGTSLTDARSILKKAGFTDLDKKKDEEMGLDVYFFYPENVKDKDDEADYIVALKNGKVLFINITYAYEDENDIFRNDIAEMMKALVASEFVLKEEKKSKPFYLYMYQSSKINSSATLGVDKNMAMFSLVLGDPKFVKLAAE